MLEQPNVTHFPTSKRERRRLLHRSQDPRLRLVSVLRAVTGWLLVMITLVFVISQYQMFMPDNLQRIVNYAQIGMGTITGDPTTITFPTGTVHAVGLFSDGLAVADSDTFYIMQPGDMTRLTEQIAYADAAITTSQNRVLIYDRGGTGITVTNGAARLLQFQVACPILSASICETGSFVVITNEEGYKSAVTVFEESGTQVYKWYSSEYYIQAAALSPSGKRLAVLVFTPQGTSLESKLFMYTVGQDEAIAEVSLGSALGMTVQFLAEDTAGIVCDTGAYVIGHTGKTLSQVSYATDDLMGFAFGGGRMAIASQSFQAGSRSAVTLMDDKGVSEEPLQITEELQSIALTNNLLGVLTSSKLHFYDLDFQPLRVTDQAVGGRRLLLQPDGVAYVLFAKEARLFTASQTEAVTDDK